MKKGLLLVVAVGAILVSCSGGQEKEAAKEFCGCYDGYMEAMGKAGNAENTTDLFAAQSEMSEAMNKMSTCLEGWQKKYEGKLDEDKLMEAIKAENKEVYELIEENGGI